MEVQNAIVFSISTLKQGIPQLDITPVRSGRFRSRRYLCRCPCGTLPHNPCSTHRNPWCPVRRGFLPPVSTYSSRNDLAQMRHSQCRPRAISGPSRFLRTARLTWLRRFATCPFGRALFAADTRERLAAEDAPSNEPIDCLPGAGQRPVWISKKMFSRRYCCNSALALPFGNCAGRWWTVVARARC